MTVTNVVKDRLARDEVVASMIVRTARGIEIAAIAKGAGFHTIYVDLEHSSFSIADATQICIAALGQGLTPFVRVPAIDSSMIERLIDGGALGIIAPHVETPEAARSIVDLVRYPPRGRRSAAGALPHFQYRPLPPGEMYAAVEEATLVIPMVESAIAVERAAEIAAVDGVSILLIGAGDLSLDLGIPGEFDHPRLHESIAKVIVACRAAGKHCGLGGLGSRPDLIEKYVRMGARYVSATSDLDLILKGARERAAFVNGLDTR